MMDENVSNFKLEYRISNNSNRELLVKTQGGLNYIIRKSKQLTHPDNQHRRVWIKLSNVKFDDLWLEPKDARTRFDAKLLELLKIEASRIHGDNALSYKKFSHDISVVIDLTGNLADEREIIHSDILGISLFADEGQVGMAPMTSPDFTLAELFDAGKDAREDQPNGGLHYFIYLNDPFSVRQPIYTNVMGKAVQVPVVQNPTKPGGLYVGLSYGNSPPHKAYYSFDRLTKEDLDFLGLFQTKELCSAMAGNTDRVISAENKVKDNFKVINGLQSERANLEGLLEKSSLSVAKLGEELTQVRAEHRQEVQQIKNDHRMELLKQYMSQEALKARSDIKDSVTKANTDLEKKRSNANNWGEIAKAITAISSIVVTGYKLYTS